MDGVGSGGGLYGDLNYTADTCRQCKDPQCKKGLPNWCNYRNRKTVALRWTTNAVLAVARVTTACPWMMATVNTETKSPQNVCYAGNAPMLVRLEH